MIIMIMMPHDHDGDTVAESAAVEAAIQKALAEAAATSIAGRDVTPFILKRVNEVREWVGGAQAKSVIACCSRAIALPPPPLPAFSPYVQLTSGASLVSNIALVKHNAAVGARLAVKLNALQVAHQQAGAGAASDAAGRGFVPQYTGRMNPLASPWATGVRRMSTSAAGGAQGLVRRLSTLASAASTAAGRQLTGRPIVVGGAVMDMLCKPLVGAELKMATSNPGVVTTSFGGVG